MYIKPWAYILIFIVTASRVDTFQKLSFSEYQFPKLKIIAQNHYKIKVIWFFRLTVKRQKIIDSPKYRETLCLSFYKIYLFLFEMTLIGILNIMHQRQIYNIYIYIYIYITNKGCSFYLSITLGKTHCMKINNEREVNKRICFCCVLSKGNPSLAYIWVVHYIWLFEKKIKHFWELGYYSRKKPNRRGGRGLRMVEDMEFPGDN